MSAKPTNTVTLHRAIFIILIEEANGGPMAFDEVARSINRKGLYSRKKDNEPLLPFQVRLRARSKGYRRYFLVTNDSVALACAGS